MYICMYVYVCMPLPMPMYMYICICICMCMCSLWHKEASPCLLSCQRPLTHLSSRAGSLRRNNLNEYAKEAIKSAAGSSLKVSF